MSKRHRHRNKLQRQQQIQQQSRAQAVVAQSAQWSGPLPPPEALQKFNEVIPGGAERILKMAELEQRHRFEREGQALVAAVSDTKRGQWLGAVVAVVAIGGAVAAAFAGAHWSIPVALVSVPVMAMIRALIVAKGPQPSAPKPPADQ